MPTTAELALIVLLLSIAGFVLGIVVVGLILRDDAREARERSDDSGTER